MKAIKIQKYIRVDNKIKVELSDMGTKNVWDIMYIMSCLSMSARET